MKKCPKCKEKVAITMNDKTLVCKNPKCMAITMPQSQEVGEKPFPDSKEFCLSDKSRELIEDGIRTYFESDVKEFIKLLKEKIFWKDILGDVRMGLNMTEEMHKRIDKLAGEKLIINEKGGEK